MKIKILGLAAETIAAFALDSVPINPMTSNLLDAGHRLMICTAPGINWLNNITNKEVCAKSGLVPFSQTIRTDRLCLIGHSLRLQSQTHSGQYSKTLTSYSLYGVDRGKTLTSYSLYGVDRGKTLTSYSLYGVDRGKTLMSYSLYGVDRGKTLMSYSLYGVDMGKTLTSYSLYGVDMGKTLTSYSLYGVDRGKTLTSYSLYGVDRGKDSLSDLNAIDCNIDNFINFSSCQLTRLVDSFD